MFYIFNLNLIMLCRLDCVHVCFFCASTDIWNWWRIRNVCKGDNGLHNVECTYKSLQDYDLYVCGFCCIFSLPWNDKYLLLLAPSWDIFLAFRLNYFMHTTSTLCFQYNQGGRNNFQQFSICESLKGG